MGGADKGEIASQLVAQQMAEYVTTRQELVLDDQHLEQALILVGEALKAYIGANPLVNRMGSTLALLQLHQQGATIAHLGDSRVFQIRNGEIIFQTKDHKQVNDMVEAGIITAHQAKTHPWRNRLSRAAMVTSMDLQNPNYQVDMPDLVLIDDILPDDYFFLCTDGVLEQVDEYVLGELLKTTVPDAEKLDILLALCEGKVKDNYSGYLIHIKQSSL
ncbi:serine/threonine-protein phosphatase [Spirosoma sp. HMF3257]|uniref:Serine/threonine-protein phosphatase n=1 Tax=Spirosoma telluris TaxID=2183553 RepID=A0A327NXP0_9BACT|nr:serine/threonine-protein phosphatase [Spirosoma telluris]RAI77658.1 serine/threonine-protein phosphatase [Spirosoma telluris]